MLDVIVGKGVWLLAVDGVITNLEMFLRHAEWDTEDILDEDHDQGGPDDVPADDEESADYLEPDLLAIAIWK